MSIFNSLEECNKVISAMIAANLPVPPAFLEEQVLFEAEPLIKKEHEEELIFNTMKAHNKFMTAEKEQVVREMTDQLMREGDDARQPCLLLGKVQCGKTDTFLSIMGLCFDRGIDIAVVMTKGTCTLADQTIKRLNKDFRFFEDKKTYEQKLKITVYNILDLYHRNGLSAFQLNDPTQKFIIVAKKESTNLEYLKEVLTKPEMRTKRILVCDDEADFASRAYYQRKGKMDLFRISELIEELTRLPEFCRYLQITATPYSLYLQPDGTVQLREGKEASPWLPRYTGLVPIHDKYIGGKQYYIDSQEGEVDENGNFHPANIYGHLYQYVTEECRAILSSVRDDFYLNANIHSQKLDPINYAVVSYMFATAVRSLQQKHKYEHASEVEKKNIKKYASSCLIHVDIEKAKHVVQTEFITRIIENIRTVLLNETDIDLHLLNMELKAYESLKESNRLGNDQGIINELMPSFTQVEKEVKLMLQFNDYTINIVNSNNPVTTMLDEKGQLNLERTMNFFIGGSILDRGITIENILCFFYGRNPGRIQMDTALQHARMYGARDKEDMACTRFFTTEDIYDVLATINRFDDYIYEYLKAHRGSVLTDEFTHMLIGYDKRIAPTAQAKYTPSNTKVVKPHQRSYPVGFQTLEPEECKPIMKKIDDIIAEAVNESQPDEQGFFLISFIKVVQILRLIRETYFYSSDYHNLDREWNIDEMITPLRHLTYNTDGMIWMKVINGRKISRERENIYTTKGRFVDAPETGAEVRIDRTQAVDRPVIVLVGQEGNILQGWRGTPFYWPILTYPSDMESGIFTLDGKKNIRSQKKQIKLSTIDNYSPEEVLKLNISRETLFQLINHEISKEIREIKQTTASLFLEKDSSNNYILISEVNPENNYNIYSLNDGVFPYKIHPYKYVHLKSSMDMSGSQALIKLLVNKPFEMIFKEYIDEDIHYDNENNAIEVTDKSKCIWSIVLNFGDILEYKFNADDEKLFELYLKDKEQK